VEKNDEIIACTVYNMTMNPFGEKEMIGGMFIHYYQRKLHGEQLGYSILK